MRVIIQQIETVVQIGLIPGVPNNRRQVVWAPYSIVGVPGYRIDLIIVGAVGKLRTFLNEIVYARGICGCGK